MRSPNLSAFDYLPDSTLLNSKDTIKCFGYKSKTASTLIRANLIPEPSIRKGEFTGYEKKYKRKSPGSRLYWRLGDLRKLKKNLDKQDQVE